MKLEIVLRYFSTHLLIFLIPSILAAQPPNDECSNAIDISYAFEGECGETIFSGPFDSTGATAGVDDPPEPERPGICLGLPNPDGLYYFDNFFGDDADAWENSIWFSFTVPDLNGDGTPVAYTFWTSDGSFGDDCGINPNNIVTEGDTQVAIYENSCPTAANDVCDYFAANDDLFDTPPWVSGFSNLEFTPGVTYYMGVDGWDAAEGEFCLTVNVCGTKCGDDTCTLDETYCDCEECRVDENGNSNCPFGNLAPVRYNEEEDGYFLSDDLSGNIFYCSEIVNGYSNDNVYLGFGVEGWADCTGTYINNVDVILSTGRFVSSISSSSHEPNIDNSDGTFNITPGALLFIELTPGEIAAGSITISSSVPDGLGVTCGETLTINFNDFPQATNPYCGLSCYAGGINTDLLDNGITICEDESFTLSTDGTEDLTLPCNVDDGSGYEYVWRLRVDIYNTGDFSAVTSWQALGSNPTIEAATFFIDEFGYVVPDFTPGSSINPIDSYTGELQQFQIQGAVVCFNADGTIKDGCPAANAGYESSLINVTYLPGGNAGCGSDNEGIPGCTDETACNYNPEATVFEGPCLYLDCEGACGGDLVEDCAGICGGNAVEDCAGNCEGSSIVGSPCVDILGNEGIFVENCFCLENDLLFQGCTDPTACNYNPLSMIDDDSCIYAATNVDCDGNCLLEVDCNDICGGTAVAGSTCVDADGNSGVYKENCVCEGTDEDEETDESNNEGENTDGETDESNSEGENTEGEEENDGGAARLFENYNWLHSHMDPNNCEAGASIMEYKYPGTNFRFLHMTEADGHGSLYSQDGIWYCTDSDNYSCTEAYGLSQAMSSWTCSASSTAENPSDHEIFATYQWLDTYIDANDCNNNYRVSTFDFGNYSFVFVESSNGGELFFEDGTLYCITTPTYDCLALYRLTNPSVSWACETETEDTVPNDDDAPEEFFETYPWLRTLVNVGNCNSVVRVYAYGNFEFVSVQHNEGTSLYFQDGTFYCSDGANYSCTGLYGLTTAIDEWRC